MDLLNGIQYLLIVFQITKLIVNNNAVGYIFVIVLSVNLLLQFIKIKF